jgi:hypothetical protein
MVSVQDQPRPAGDGKGHQDAEKLHANADMSMLQNMPAPATPPVAMPEPTVPATSALRIDGPSATGTSFWSSSSYFVISAATPRLTFQ